MDEQSDEVERIRARLVGANLVNATPADLRTLLAEVERIRDAEQERDALKSALALAAEDWRKSARDLRSEVERGIAIRQTPESKISRATVLEACADRTDQIRALVCEDPESRVERMRAEIDSLRAQLPSPAAVRAARVKAAEVIEEWIAREGTLPEAGGRGTANVISDVLRDLARTYLGRHDDGGDVDAATLAMIALDVDGLATLGELEEMARELREVAGG